ncbi:MAG: hypothetical protein Q9170_005955 [Blastenia crenularia]
MYQQFAPPTMQQSGPRPTWQQQGPSPTTRLYERQPHWHYTTGLASSMAILGQEPLYRPANTSYEDLPNPATTSYNEMSSAYHERENQGHNEKKESDLSTSSSKPRSGDEYEYRHETLAKQPETSESMDHRHFSQQPQPRTGQGFNRGEQQPRTSTTATGESRFKAVASSANESQSGTTRTQEQQEADPLDAAEPVNKYTLKDSTHRTRASAATLQRGLEPQRGRGQNSLSNPRWATRGGGIEFRNESKDGEFLNDNGNVQVNKGDNKWIKWEQAHFDESDKEWLKHKREYLLNMGYKEEQLEIIGVGTEPDIPEEDDRLVTKEQAD